MNKRILWLALLCVVAAAFLFWLRRSGPTRANRQFSETVPPKPMDLRETVNNPSIHQSTNPLVQQSIPIPPSNPPALSQAVTPAPHFDTALLASPGSPAPKLPPETVLANVRHAVLQYGSMFDGNPVGTNEEITRALNGDNPKQANFLDAQAGMRVNGQGELIDSWGTPYFFHQLSKSEMEIRSAGPDRTMWTADDLVTR